MFLNSRAMYIFHPIISDVNLFFYKWSYLVKNLFTFRPGRKHILTQFLFGLSYNLLTYGRKSSQIAISSKNLFPQSYMAASHSMGLFSSVQFSDTSNDYSVKNYNTITPLLPWYSFPLLPWFIIKICMYHPPIYYISTYLFICVSSLIRYKLHNRKGFVCIPSL